MLLSKGGELKRLVLNLGQKELKRARHRCLRRCCLVATCVSSPPELLAQLAVALHKTCSSSSSSSLLLLSARPSRSGRVVIEAGTAHHRAGGAVLVPRRQIRCREAALDTGKQSNTTFQPAPVPHHHPLPPPPPPPPPPSIWVLQTFACKSVSHRVSATLTSDLNLLYFHYSYRG